MKLEHDFDSNFRYVIVAARRARQLQNGAAPMVASKTGKASKLAQQEINAGLVQHIRHDVPVIKPGIEGAEIPRFA